MTTTLKFKSIWYSFFQAQNSMLIQKSIKPVDRDTLDENKKKNNNKALIVADDPVDDYRIKREKNNESVRKSRAKNRVKLQECAVRVKELKDENVELNTKLTGLQTELSTLRNLFQYCFSFNSNSMAVKPSEIPTSTLYKMIMENKTKFMQPYTAASIANEAFQAQSTPVVQVVEQTKPSYSTSNSFEAVLEQSRLLSLDDFDKSAITVTQQQQQQQDQAIFDEKDSFFINELKQSLIDFIKYEDTPSASASNVSSPFMSSPTTPSPSSNNNDFNLINENEIIIGNDEVILSNTNDLASFLDDHDYSVKRAKLNI